MNNSILSDYFSKDDTSYLFDIIVKMDTFRHGLDTF